VPVHQRPVSVVSSKPKINPGALKEFRQVINEGNDAVPDDAPDFMK